MVKSSPKPKKKLNSGNFLIGCRNLQADDAIFSKKYLFIEVRMQEIGGPEALQRFLLELKAGTVKDFDTSEASSEFFLEFAAHAMKMDFLNMAQKGILGFNPQMVDPESRAVVAVASSICSIAYNKNRLAPNAVPDKWEDFLKPEFKGRKFIADIRPQCMASMMAGMGEEWVIKYCSSVKEQQPVWWLAMPGPWAPSQAENRLLTR